jgi:hypothetical protein
VGRMVTSSRESRFVPAPKVLAVQESVRDETTDSFRSLC